MTAPTVDLASFPITARPVALADEAEHITRERTVCAAVSAALALPGLAASAEPIGANLSYCGTSTPATVSEYRLRINGTSAGLYAAKEVEFVSVSLVALAGDAVVAWSEDVATSRLADAARLALVDAREVPVFITDALRAEIAAKLPPAPPRKGKALVFTREAFDKRYPPRAAAPFDAAALIAAAKPAAGPLAWTRKTRKNLHGFVTKTTFDPPDARTVPSASEAWAALRALAERDVTIAPAASLAPTVSRVAAELAAVEAPAVDVSVELYRAALVLGHRNDRDWCEWDDWAPERAMVNFWAVVGGVEKTLAVLLAHGAFWLEESGTVTVRGDVTASTSTLSFLDAPGAWSGAQPFDFRFGGDIRQRAVWAALRCHVDALDDAAFAEATRAAHAARARLATDDVAGRAAVAFAFRRDPSHALDELARFEVVGPNSSFDPRIPHYYMAAQLLLLAAPTVAAAAPVLAWCVGSYTSLHDLAFDLVECFGGGAAPLLQRSVHLSEDAREAGRRRKSLLAALKLVAP